MFMTKDESFLTSYFIFEQHIKHQVHYSVPVQVK